MRSNGNCWIVANYTWSGWRPRYRPPSGERSKITLVEDYNHRFRRLLGNAGAYALGRAQKNRVFTNGLLLGQALVNSELAGCVSPLSDYSVPITNHDKLRQGPKCGDK